MSNYHVVRLAPVVNLTLRNNLNQDPNLDAMSYAECLEYILQGQYNYSDVFRHEMQRHGNRCDEIVFDVEPLQKKWAKEHNVKLHEGEQWQLKIALAQLKKINPDVVYLQGFTRIRVCDIEKVRSEIPNLKKIVVHSGFPNGLDVVNPDTLILAGFPCIQKAFSDIGCEAHLVYHCFDERLLSHMQERDTVPFSFIGTSGYGYGEGHKTRYWELLKLGHHTPLEVWLDDKDSFTDPSGPANPFIDQPLKAHFYSDIQGDLSQYPNPFTPMRNLFDKSRVHHPAYGVEFFQVMRDSLVSFQRHTDAMFHEVGAMRVFQVTGVGSCLLTNSGSNMSDLFEEDTEVVTYSSLEECIEKANYLVDHPDIAREIARKGQEKTLKVHSAKERYGLVHHLISNALSKKK